MTDENELAARFPDAFPKKIKTFLFKMMREVAEPSKVYLQDQFTSLPKLRDFDWRMDVKISSRQEDRMKQATLYVKMDLEKDQAADTSSAQQEADQTTGAAAAAGQD